MKILLTSFGINHFQKKPEGYKCFYKMPPVKMSNVGGFFIPEYDLLLFADKLIVDKNSFELLKNSGQSSQFRIISETFSELYDEGFIQIENFEKVIFENTNHIELMLNRDLKNLDLWVNPLKCSLELWQEFLHTIPKYIFEGLIINDLEYEPHSMFPYLADRIINISKNQITERNQKLKDALNSSIKRRKSEYKTILKQVLHEYLSYVNINLILSNTYDCAFYDWNDYSPFYNEKFFQIGKHSFPLEKEINAIRKLFSVSLPEFSFWDSRKFIKALKDKRISDFRNMVSESLNENIEFDKAFANRILSEVFTIEIKLKKIRNIVSYSTMPLGYIPYVGTPLQKIVEESIINPVEKKKKEKYKWFYFISEISKT